MGYGFGSWDRTKKGAVPAVDQRAYARRGLATWDARWHELTPEARSTFINVVKGPARNQADHAPTYSVAKDKFPPRALEELTAAGFVQILAARSRASADRVFAPAKLYDFAARVRMLNRHHLLDADRSIELSNYVDQAFYVNQLAGILDDVLRRAAMEDFHRLDVVLKRYVTNHRWPGWVARVLKDPLADRVLEAVQGAGGPIPVVELPGRIPGSDPDEVRAAADRLIARLVLVEDLRPETFEILIGFLPAVREGLILSSRPRERPPLVVCERPGEVGPDESAIVNDLRALLLEVASEPPRLRQDNGLFQKEVERFKAGLDPLPSWLLATLRWSDEGRLSQALAWARTLGLVQDVAEGSQVRLRLTPAGHRWLSSGLDVQYAGVYGLVTALPSRSGMPPAYWRLFHNGPDWYYSGILNDTRFLGENLLVLRTEPGKRPASYWQAKPEDFQALRTAMERAFAALEPGTFYRLDSIGPHLVFGEHNPVNLGLAPDRVAVIRDEQLVSPLEEMREEAGRSLIESFVCRRLIPLGCVRAAIDGEGKVCIARGRRLDAYFGHELAGADLAPASDVAARVVVQPDFSVIVIGLNPTAAAELAPFCERTRGGGGQGAMILKITRESVIRAVGNGLKPAEIAGRLRRHASHEVPANVLHEVGEWSSWVRQVTPATLSVLRCPDRDTADRVLSALRRQAERLNDTLVAVDRKLTAAERNKLRTQGIIVQGDPEAPVARPKSRKKGRRW
jgi:hypothetical protein